jgi:hypothetical protein
MLMKSNVKPSNDLICYVSYPWLLHAFRVIFDFKKSFQVA